MNFATLQGLTIPEGVVTQIADASGRVLWALSGGKVVLEVQKITSDTYAGETTYTGEQFILLDIYPKTNGTVKVTYGGLTKTITDTSGAAEPNAQQVFFGTFNDVSDSVETPASGKLTIEGDYYAFACGQFKEDKSGYSYCNCVQAITSFGNVISIPANAFGDTAVNSKCCTSIKTITIPEGVTSIGNYAFAGCSRLKNVTIPSSVQHIGDNPFCSGGFWINTVPNFQITLDSKNTAYKIDGNCLVEIPTNKVISGFEDSIIPSYITSIGSYAFNGRTGEMDTITVPENVTNIGCCAFDGDSSLTSIIFENPNGWYVSTDDGDVAVDLSDPANNANLFKSTYNTIYDTWYRS